MFFPPRKPTYQLPQPRQAEEAVSFISAPDQIARVDRARAAKRWAVLRRLFGVGLVLLVTLGLITVLASWNF